MSDVTDDESAMMAGVLREVFPIECGIAGKTNLADIVSRRGQVNFVGLDRGSRMDFSAALTILTAGAALIAKALEMIKALPKKNGEKSALLTLEIKAQIPTALLEKLTPEAAEKIILTVLNHAARSDAASGQRDRVAPDIGLDA